jgi:RNA polymerase sigma-54 factor
MLKQTLSQKLLQKLSPQQIQFIKLLQLNTMDFEQKMEQEVLDNPALEKGKEDGQESRDDNTSDFEDLQNGNDIDITDYLNKDNYGGVKLNDDYNDEQNEIPIAESKSFIDYLLEQARTNIIDSQELALAIYLIGAIEEDGYLRRELRAIKNDLAFSENQIISEEELEKALMAVQSLDPAGIGARSLQECLLLQLYRKNSTQNDSMNIAIKILEKYMDSFTKKHYTKIMRSLKIDEEELKLAIKEITKLNPKPGQTQMTTSKTQYIIPDFILYNSGGKMEIVLNSKNAPELRLSSSYSEALQSYEKSSKTDKKLKDTVQFIKQKLDGAKWFIDSVKQRQKTLLDTMNAILHSQKEYFVEGDETKLKPMILKDIAEKVDLDISTISRVANSKYIQTDFGIIPLKFFFSEGIMSDSGEEVSNREVKKILQEAVENENKTKPLTDEKLMNLLKDKGYNIARRTVAKYREQQNIPVARLRKKL